MNRKLSLLLVVVLVFSSLLAACSTKSDTTAAPTTTSASASAAEEKEVVNLSLWEPSINLEDAEGIKNDRVKLWIEDKFKVNLNLMAGDLEKIKLLVSTGQAADITSFPLYFGGAAQDFLKKMIKEDMVYDLGALISANPDRYPTLAKITQEKEFRFFNYNFSDLSEKLYAIWTGDNVVNVSGAPIYNMKIMNELNLKIPETVDEFVNVLRTIKKAKPDIIPFNFVNWKGQLPAELDMIFFQPISGLRADALVQDAEGKWFDTAIDPKNKEVWKLIQQLFKEGLIDKETFTKDAYYLGTNDFANDKVAVITFACPNANTGQYLFMFGEFKKVHPTATYNDAPMQPSSLVGPAGTGKTVASPFAVHTALVIPKTSKYPERALELINWFFSDEGQVTKFYGLEGVHHTKDSSGNLVLNEAEWKKDTDVWKLGGFHGLFFTLTYASGAMVNYDQYGWFEGHKNQVFIENERSLKDPDAKAVNDVLVKWQKEAYQAEPIFKKYVSLDQANKDILTKLKEIKTRYFTKFLFGELDVEAGWDEFVNEYNAAGLDKYISAYGKAYASLKNVFEAIQ